MGGWRTIGSCEVRSSWPRLGAIVVRASCNESFGDERKVTGGWVAKLSEFDKVGAGREIEAQHNPHVCFYIFPAEARPESL